MFDAINGLKTTFPEEFPTKQILEFYAPKPLLLDGEDSKGAASDEHFIFVLHGANCQRSTTYAILFVGLKHSSRRSFDGTIESTHTIFIRIIFPTTLLVIIILYFWDNCEIVQLKNCFEVMEKMEIRFKPVDWWSFQRFVINYLWCDAIQCVMSFYFSSFYLFLSILLRDEDKEWTFFDHYIIL